MNKLPISTWLRIASLASLVTSSHAATDVYSQPQSGHFANTSAVYNVGPADPGFTWSLDQDEEVWAYFSLPQTATFNRISWYGSNTDGDFAVDLFAAACFSCGINLVQTGGTFATNLLPNSGPYSQAQVHKTQVAGSIYSYSVDLASSVTLGGSGAYAISVVNNYSALPFLWAASSAGSGTYLQYVVGQAIVLPAPGNLAFTLTNTSAVPEPPSWWLMLLGMGFRWRSLKGARTPPSRQGVAGSRFAAAVR
jgi:hypothetical protein